MRVRFRYTLSLQLALIFVTALILVEVMLVIVDRRFAIELNRERLLGNGRSLAANLITTLPDIPNEIRPELVRTYSWRAVQFFLLPEVVPGPEGIPLPDLEKQTREWALARRLPVSDVFAEQYYFAWTGGPSGLAGSTTDNFSAIFSAGERPRRRMADLVSEPPLWVPLPPPLGHPPLPDRLEQATRIEYHPVVTIAMKHEPSGQWLTAYMHLRPPPDNNFVAKLVLTILGMVVIGSVALFLGRRVMTPFTRVARSAEQLGRGDVADPVPLSGPSDMRSVITAFNRMNGRITQSIDYQIGLLRSLGHDLKGPLASANRLLDEVKPESTREQIELRLSRVRAIVDSIMNFSRAVMRDSPMQRTDLAELVNTLVAEQQEMGAHVEIEAPESLPVTCRINATERAIRNLLENALKYGGRAQIRLSKEDDMAVLCIEDSGPGIPEDMLEEVFVPFRRLADNIEGSGLGLAIARTIAVDQGGTVSIFNRPEGGLRAELRLPLSN